MIEFPCGVCNRAVAKNHKAICCDICHNWIHINCNNLDKNDYRYFQENTNEIFFCINCLSDNIPFSKLNNNEFEISDKKGLLFSDLDKIDFIPSDYQKNVFEKLNLAINNNAFDLDTEFDTEENEVTSTIDCKYYDIDDFVSEKINPTKTFSVLHYNIHSIERHIEEFRVALIMLKHNFDIICISESKIMQGIDPKVNINIEGYQTPISKPTEATKGGVLIYVRTGINFKPRNDLTVYKSKELESIFIEIVNKKNLMT